MYGHQHVGTVTQNANATNLITADATDIAAAQGDQYRRHIAFYPYTDPNSFFIGTGSNGNNITITLDREIESIKSGAKIFRVTPIRYFVDTNSSELRITPTLNLGSEETLIYDVQDFQLAYSIDGETWLEAPTLNQSRNVKIIWAYLLIRSREQEPGFQESRNLHFHGIALKYKDQTFLQDFTTMNYTPKLAAKCFVATRMAASLLLNY